MVGPSGAGDLCLLEFQTVLNNWSWSFPAVSWQLSAQGHCRHRCHLP